MSDDLNPDKALIFRIVHRSNVPWILDNGMHCRNSHVQSPNYRTIGNQELIDRRPRIAVPVAPGGILSDYIPFYFTPFSPMLFNIHTGWAGMSKVPNEDIVIFVSSLFHLNGLQRAFVFSDRNACLATVQFFNGTDNLDRIDWRILQERDFRRDLEDPGKIERYQAEALVHQHASVASLLGVTCYTEKIKRQIEGLVRQRNLRLRVHALPGWYFR